MRRYLDADESDDPMLSVVNVIDVFLVIVVMLLIVVAQQTAALFDATSAGATLPDTSETLEKYESSGEMGEGTGVRAGTTYRLQDGTLVFVADN